MNRLHLRRPDAHTALAAFCGVLIVAGLAVSLVNVASFAALFEPRTELAWAYACYVDLALVGYTVARARLGTRMVSVGMGWFIGLSLLANVVVVLARYDAARGAALVADVLRSGWGLAIGAVFAVSIPLSVLTFAHTVADALRARRTTLLQKIADEMAKSMERTGETMVKTLTRPAVTFTLNDAKTADVSTSDPILDAIRSDPDASNRSIARRLHVSDKRVAAVRKAVTP